MRWRIALATITLCFGVGLGLGPLIPQARACSCAGPTSTGASPVILGDGDVAVERAYWTPEIELSAESNQSLPHQGALFLGADEEPLRLETIE
ncbi:MAG: hypothetical protein R3A51_14420 [Nannocystaceae bacterium]